MKRHYTYNFTAILISDIPALEGLGTMLWVLGTLVYQPIVILKLDRGKSYKDVKNSYANWLAIVNGGFMSFFFTLAVRYRSYRLHHWVRQVQRDCQKRPSRARVSFVQDPGSREVVKRPPLVIVARIQYCC